MDCYVYYKSAQVHETQIVQQVKIFEKSVSAEMNIRLQLQRRPNVEKGIITWMEIYRDIPPSFAEVLSAAKAQAELMSLIQGERHAEYFEDAIPCA